MEYKFNYQIGGIGMKIKKVVAILIGVTLIAFGVGLLSLKHYAHKAGISNSKNSILNLVIDNIIESAHNSDYVEKNIDEEIIKNIAGIDTVDIEVPFSNINIIPESRDNVKIHYKGYVKANFIPQLKTRTSNDTLYIYLEQEAGKPYNTKRVDLKLNIYIPKDYKKNMKIYTSFGHINVSDLNISQLKLDSSYGHIEIKNLRGDVEANTSYGDIIAKNYSGNITAITCFGDIILEYMDFDNNIIATTSFGNIKLILPKNSQFIIDAHCSLGDIDVDFPVTISKNEKNRIAGRVGNSRNNIKLEADSGDIKIISK